MLLTNEELHKELMTCIIVRMCFIETGTHYLRATDAIKSGQPELVQPLDENQRRLIVALEEFMREASTAPLRTLGAVVRR